MTPHPIDHLVLAVRDLDAAAATYERLGFRVGGVNRHPQGTANRLIQFDGAFLELITIAEPARIPDHQPERFSFGAFVRDALARGEGCAMLALASEDAVGDAAQFHAAGLGDADPFRFARQGTGSDGAPVEVAFSLAFARDPLAPEAGLFTCQQHRPEHFWNPALQDHPNGARGVMSVAMVADNPSDHHIALEAFTGVRAPRATSLGLEFPLPRRGAVAGRLDVLTPVAAGFAYGLTALPEAAEGRFAAVTIAVPDVGAVATRLSQAGVAYAKLDSRLVVPADAAHGLAIAFTAG